MEFVVDAGFTSSVAYGTTYMKYFGTTGELTTDVTVKRDGSTVGTDSDPEAYDNIYPWVLELISGGNVPIEGSCGLTVEARGTGSAWHQYRGSSWGKQKKSDKKNASQPACRQEDKVEPTGAGGGCDGAGGSCQDEYPENGYQWCVVRYSYDLNTGEILSWRTLYCY